MDSGHFMLPKGTMVSVGGGGGGGGGALGNGHFENWGDSGVVADHSQQTDTSTDTDDKNQVLLHFSFLFVLEFYMLCYLCDLESINVIL